MAEKTKKEINKKIKAPQQIHHYFQVRASKRSILTGRFMISLILVHTADDIYTATTLAGNILNNSAGYKGKFLFTGKYCSSPVHKPNTKQWVNIKNRTILKLVKVSNKKAKILAFLMNGV